VRLRHSSSLSDESERCSPVTISCGSTIRLVTPVNGCDDDVFYLFLQKQKIEAELHIYLEEGTYHKRLFRGPNTNDMKKWDGPSLSFFKSR